MRKFVLLPIGALFFFLYISAAGSTTARADVTSTYLDRIKPSLVLIAAQQESETSIGTGWCIYAKNGVSYFVTNHHVIASEETDKPYTTIQVVLPSNPTKRYPATVVKAGSVLKDWPPDLAVISAPVGNFPELRLSSQRPLEGTNVGIAGFPAFQIKVWLQQTQGQELRPSFHEGHVNALTLGDFYVQYDALTDQGNSGGPVFDVSTAAVYGVVEESVKGQSVSNNLALSEVVLRRFIASLALPIKLAPYDHRLAPPADERAVAHVSDVCTVALEHFSKHFNEVVSDRSRMANAGPGVTGAVMGRLAQVEAALARHGLSRDVTAIGTSGAKKTDALAKAVYADLLAAGPGPINASPKLQSDVLKFDTLGDCSTDQ